MAISINELLAKKDEIKNKKKALYDLETSIGTITIKTPSKALIASAMDMEQRGDEYLIMNSVVEPNLKAQELLDGFNCFEPLDIVSEVFEVGEVSRLANAIMKAAGFTGDIPAKLHEEVKN